MTTRKMLFLLTSMAFLACTASVWLATMVRLSPSRDLAKSSSTLS